VARTFWRVPRTNCMAAHHTPGPALWQVSIANPQAAALLDGGTPGRL